jgi:hypothetical protein
MAQAGPAYKRIHVTGDWGVGIVTDARYPQNTDVILSTDGLVGCNALFFVSKGGRWLCHVMNNWLSGEELRRKGMSIDDLHSNLLQAAGDFQKATGTEITRVYICQHEDSSLSKTLAEWVQTNLPKANLKVEAQRSGKWYIGKDSVPRADNPPIPIARALNYGEENFSRARHLNANGMPGVWNRPFVPSPVYGHRGPEYMEDVAARRRQRAPRRQRALPYPRKVLIWLLKKELRKASVRTFRQAFESVYGKVRSNRARQALQVMLREIPPRMLQKPVRKRRANRVPRQVAGPLRFLQAAAPDTPVVSNQSTDDKPKSNTSKFKD